MEKLDCVIAGSIESIKRKKKKLKKKLKKVKKRLTKARSETLKVGIDFKIAETDLLKTYSFDEAITECKKLGNGWRLPTKNELNLMYQNRKAIGGFISYIYWSSTKLSAGDVWQQNFDTGYQYSYGKDYSYRVRAVRDLVGE